MKTLDNLQEYVERCIEKYQLPAMSMAVWHKGVHYKAAAGILNATTGVEASPDSIFQIGSISKVFTATLVMQLVDEGLVELDQPVKKYLREFHVACPKATKTISVRQLICHTSGIAGDLFPEDGANENNLARYVDRCYLLQQIHPPGDQFSYSNTALCIAGRLVEVVLGCTWAEAIEERIVKPLGMQQVAVSPHETLRFKAAMGHEVASTSSEGFQPVTQCYFPLSMGPSGTILTMSASELITFSLAHLNGGKSQFNEQWLSEGATKNMQTSQRALPEHSPGFLTDCGLGWLMFNQPGSPTMYGHDGSVIGQCSMLRVIPEEELTFSVLLNSDDFTALGNIFIEFVEEMTGYVYQLPEPDPAIALDHLDKYCGRYQSLGEIFDISLEQGGLVARTTLLTVNAPEQKLYLKPINQNCFAVYTEHGDRQHTISFLNINEQGQPDYLFSYYARLCPRVL